MNTIFNCRLFKEMVLFTVRWRRCQVVAVGANVRYRYRRLPHTESRDRANIYKTKIID